MKKQMIVSAAVLTLAFSAFFGAGTVTAAEPAKAPQEELIIDGKKPARFSHPTHIDLGLDCAACHHDQEHNPLTAEAIGGLSDPGALKCVSCHNSQHPNKDLQNAKDVFHAQCKDCHQQGFAGKEGPTTCTSCHLKKKTKGYEGC
ncbi:MAG: cytochrome c family protein [Desulfobulbaceae bacterium]|nr:cytochrome c family protein [Desulfobulbaceae bacterium]